MASKSTFPSGSPPFALAALAVEVSRVAPTRFRVLPAGEFRAKDGRPRECKAWVCTNERGRALVAALSARPTPLYIDYEHATLHARAEGKKAPAAGWVGGYEWVDDDGLYFTGVQWAATAAAEIEADEYRFISPLFPYNEKTGEVLGLFPCALTNDPALVGLCDLSVAATLAALSGDVATMIPTTTKKDSAMEELLEQLRWMLNLPVGATVDDVKAQLQKLMDQLGTNPTAAASFDLHGHLAALSAQVAAPSPEKFVPVATLSAVQAEKATLAAELQGLRDAQATAALSAEIARGENLGKITPAMKAWAEELGKSNLAALSTFIDAAPVAVPLGTQTDGKVPEGVQLAALSATELAVCAQLGTSPEDFSKAKAA